MSSNKIHKSLAYRLIASMFVVLPVSAEEQDNPWPASWLTPFQVSSEVGLKSFGESPFSKRLADEGKLPPVHDRLPLDPVVIEPIDEIGKYGGTARVFPRGVNGINPTENPLTIDPKARNLLPNYFSNWEITEGGRVITFNLRPGIKWSDGDPLTAGDFIFHHQHVMLNKEITPILDRRWIGSEVTAPDPYTVVYRFRQPFPLLPNVMAQLGDFFVTAEHYMKQFHPAFVDRDELIARIRDEGYISWMAYFRAIRIWTRNDPPLTPTLRPFQFIKRTPTSELYERNHYYAKVDTAGNQLPYIDRFTAERVENQDVIAAKAATGQVDFSSFDLKTQDFPLFKLGEKTSGVKVHVWNRLHGSDILIQPNLTIEDERLRPIMQDFRFRRALSIAINRDEMNSVIYFNRGVPRQATVIPTSRFFEESFATSHTNYDPDTAGELLDEMGLTDPDGDGYRNYPDGEPLTITLEFLDFETPKNISLELVSAYWREVGLDIRLKQVDNALQTQRATAGLMQMTVWHADRTTDILFPFQPQWWVPMRIGWEESHWNAWSYWNLSGGERGEKPPPEIASLYSWWDELTQSTDEDRITELGKNILRSSAENLWTIGTVGLAPQPVVTAQRLKNVAPTGFWGWDNRWTMPYHPPTWYLEQ